MHYFIGNHSYSPHNETRYLAVTGAHIAHMLRDTFDDVQAGYYNIPREVLEANHIQTARYTEQRHIALWVQQPCAIGTQVFSKRGNISPRLRNRAADWQVLLIWPASSGCWIRSNGNIISFARSTAERKSLGTGLRMGLSTLFATRSTVRPARNFAASPLFRSH